MTTKKRTVDYFAKYYSHCYERQVLKLEKGSLRFGSPEYKFAQKSIIEIKIRLKDLKNALDLIEKEAITEAEKDYEKYSEER